MYVYIYIYIHTQVCWLRPKIWLSRNVGCFTRDLHDCVVSSCSAAVEQPCRVVPKRRSSDGLKRRDFSRECCVQTMIWYGRPRSSSWASGSPGPRTRNDRYNIISYNVLQYQYCYNVVYHANSML